MTKLLHKELTGEIIGAYYEVYNHTSRVYPEYIYEQALIEELKRRGCPATRQNEYQIYYKERLVGLQRLDIFVVQEVVVENKVVEELLPIHRAQCYSYLKTVSKPVGLLFNFGSEKPEFARLFSDPDRQASTSSIQSDPEIDMDANWLYPELTYSIMGGLYEVYNLLGPGYVHRIYSKACQHELSLRGHNVWYGKSIEVEYKDTIVGNISLGHLHVDDKVMVFPIARRSVDDLHLDNVKEWLRMNSVDIGIVANFNAVRLDFLTVRS